MITCHSEERSDEESRFRQTGVFFWANNEILRLRCASAQNDRPYHFHCGEVLDYKDAANKLAQALDGSMVHVPAGEFIIGNDAGNPDECPQRQVYLDAFEIDQYEVTTFRNMTHCYAPNYRVGFRCARSAD